MMIPCLVFSEGGLELEEGSEEWRAMSRRVREACETHGCFLLLHNRGSLIRLQEEMLTAMKALFDLPEETKMKHTSPKPYRSYHANCPVIPLCQSFGVDDAPLPHIAQAFTRLMWPHGDPTFCETLKSMSEEMLELNYVLLKMIVEGLGLPKHYISDAEKMKSTSNFRMIKYRAPSSSGVQHLETGLVPHTDKCAITTLCQNDVQGLQVLTKQGHWIDVNVPHDGLVVVVGDILKAWSNGRLHAVTHRVMMGGNKERYSFAQFALPKEEDEIEVPPELVDSDHPLLYRPFNYGKYFDYYTSSLKENALEVFAGV
ncbi:2-oxoglutarate-dependent dioxygenase AOP2 [Neltuma alba]|uniref:2-oxoglutarate-dependent dioxygenase AOP2 n=1 Tax=Neltuma alba TaxID=207710 RepID=UPI0010A52FDA|nr:2-oxoglutarate-dependent dioxygenase AOP2-like [Prosopis alba]